MDTRIIATSLFSALFALISNQWERPKQDEPQASTFKHERAKPTTLVANTQVDQTVMQEALIVLDKVKDGLSDIEKRSANVEAMLKSQSLSSYTAPDKLEITKDELRLVVREELERYGKGLSLSTTSSKDIQVATGVNSVTAVSSPLADRVVYQTGGSTGGSSPSVPIRTVYAMPQPTTYSTSSSYQAYSSGGSTGGSSTYNSTPSYSTTTYSESYGSTGGASYAATPVAPVYRTPIRSTISAISAEVKPIQRRIFSGVSEGRYYVNETGCTVDRVTGKVIACPASR